MKKASTVLIVDDEKPIRQWFEYVIRQYDEEFEIAGVCSNGMEALQMYEQRKPDIIITDIRMPVMDGLELIRSIKARGGCAQFLILSNYDRFEYVKQGLVMGAKDYLLKAETADQEIIEALRSIREASDGERQLTDEREDSAQIMKALIRDYLCHNAVDQEPLQKITNYLNIASSQLRYIVTYSVDRHPSGAWPSPPLSSLVPERLQKPPFAISMELQTGDNEFVLIVEDREGFALSAIEALRGFCHALNDEAGRRYNGTLSFGIGTAFESLEQMKRSYLEAREAKDNRFYTGPSGVHVYDGQKKDEAVRERCLTKIRDFIRSVQLPDEHALERAKQCIDVILDEGERGLPPEETKKIIVMLLEMFSHKLIGMVESAGSGTRRLLLDSADLLQESEFKESFRERAAGRLEAMLAAASGQLYRYSEATNRIIRYLYEHYSHKVEMAQLARLVHLNENYISQLFKKETGQSVTKWLLSIRMERAKQLLQEKKLKINEIACEVGYASESHFCTAFKLFYGKSPRHFKNEEQ